MLKWTLIFLVFVTTTFSQSYEESFIINYDQPLHVTVPPGIDTNWTISDSLSFSSNLGGTGPITVSWGDSTTNTYTLTSTPQAVNHSYTYKIGTRVISFSNKNNVNSITISSNSNLYLDLSTLPKYLVNFVDTHTNSITGNLSSLSVLSLLYTFNCKGLNKITGSLSAIPDSVNTFIVTGNNTIDAYTSGHYWNWNLDQVSITTLSGGLTSTMVDQIFIDINNSVINTGYITLNGTGIGAPTVASAAARANLIANGWTIVTN